MYFDGAALNERVDEVINYLKLVINCVLYLQSYPDDIEEDYTSEAPRNLVEHPRHSFQLMTVQTGYKIFTG